MSDWVNRIRDEGKKLERRLEVAIAEAEQHLSAAEGVDTVDLDAAEDGNDGERVVEEAETPPPETETTPPEAEGSGSTTTPNA
ncbi:MAG TPA: hypothetical protein VIW24_17075 [Aldersonia sp.]